ncbi:MAG: cupin domain-containing protein [Actinobacteria bacterium]|nr:cupin domain-containing protein [Actinomycetota bacterium]
MEALDLTRLLSGHDFSEEPYLEFLRVPSLSVGLYVLPAGTADPQQPHTEDEVYHVVGGRARIRVGAEDRAVEAGMVVFVEAGADHWFHAIEEDLTVLVFFAPAEGSRGER